MCGGPNPLNGWTGKLRRKKDAPPASDQERLHHQIQNCAMLDWRLSKIFLIGNLHLLNTYRLGVQMSFAVFIHRFDSIYDDSPSERYQFPKMYLERVSACVGDWIVYLEPTKVRNTRGYFAVAKVEKVIPDPTHDGMYLALIEPGTYLDFINPVPFNGRYGVVEKGVLNERGRNSGRAQAAVRALAPEDFNRILDYGLADDDEFLPRSDELNQPGNPNEPDNALHEEREPFIFQGDEQLSRRRVLTSRQERDRAFRQLVVKAYDSRCAITGLKLINGGGRAEVEAAHIKPVSAGGADIVSNGIALSGTVHWMFDRGLVSLRDDLKIIISRQANDPEAITGLVNKSGFAYAPSRESARPNSQFLAWHRENCFKS